VTENNLLQRREAYFSGRVQGVGFRYTTRYVASRYKVAGYVRNLRDGRVEVVVEGLVSELDAFFSEIGAGLGRYIADVQQTVLPPTGEFHQFDIRF